MRVFAKPVLISIFVLSLFFTAAVPLFAQTLNAPEEGSTENITLSSGEVVDEDYFTAGETVTIDGTVNGDAYAGGGNVFVNGTINGDLLTAGGNVTIRGTITGNIRVAGGNVLISGNVGENITALGGNVTLTDSSTVTGSLTAGAGNLQVYGPIGGGMTLGVGKATLSNSVGGNITAGVGTLDLLSGSSVTGNLTYWSEDEARISPDATVAGSLTHNMPPADRQVDTQDTARVLTSAVILFKLFSIAAALLTGLIIIKLSPLFVDRVSDTATTQLGKSLLLGLAAFILIPIAAFILLITLIGIPLGLITIVIYGIALYFAKIFAALTVGKKVFGYATKAKIARGWPLLIGLVILGVLDFIPLIGWLVNFVAVLVGLGALIILKKEYYTTLRDKKII